MSALKYKISSKLGIVVHLVLDEKEKKECEKVEGKQNCFMIEKIIKKSCLTILSWTIV
jgi:hypothetical protein